MEVEGGYHLLLLAKGLQRPKFTGGGCFMVGVGVGERSCLTYTISYDSGEPGDQTDTAPDDWTVADHRSGFQPPQPGAWDWESHLWTMHFV